MPLTTPTPVAAGLQREISKAAKSMTVDDLVRMLADEADALLVDALGLDTATRWWSTWLTDTAGYRAVRYVEDAKKYTA
ncbi:hypothetical protein [Saccharospirillum sp.]|uniref:hypothetical protein n=1 Tax=Saccharospirillum sp. TaxID=2033801 RepID=UPI0034A02E46